MYTFLFNAVPCLIKAVVIIKDIFYKGAYMFITHGRHWPMRCCLYMSWNHSLSLYMHNFYPFMSIHRCTMHTELSIQISFIEGLLEDSNTYFTKSFFKIKENSPLRCYRRHLGYLRRDLDLACLNIWWQVFGKHVYTCIYL